MRETQTNSPGPREALAGLDLLLEVRRPRVRQGLTTALRDAVRSGRLVPGTRLPASRVLAADLGIARSTVSECYTDLVAEGWLTSQQGSGTRVASRARAGKAPLDSIGGTSGDVKAIQGLVPGASDFADFPRQQWLAAARRALSAAPYSAFGYGDPAGHPQLRATLAEYLARVRGVSADPRRTVICSGFHHGLDLVAGALAAHGTTAVAVESYGLDLYRRLLEARGMQTPDIGVDEQGARTSDLENVSAGAVLLTPAHQFPTGVALSADRRGAAIDWARATGGFILEDDYDGEFRYDRTPIGALQSLDPERVLYFGTSSKSLAPALRVAWMVVPEALLSSVLEAKGRVETVSVLDQLTLSEFISSGSFDHHIRSRRNNYRRRRDRLIEALAQNVPQVRLRGMPAGLQALLGLPAGTEDNVVAAAKRHGLAVTGLAPFRYGATTVDEARDDGLVVNYSAISDSTWDNALDLLIVALRDGLGLVRPDTPNRP
jgi:GntR family transcriptional regulator/MocR family aminotransferase